MGNLKDFFESEQSNLIGACFIDNGCPDVHIDISGYCPVQAFGIIEGDVFYFRARHDSWRIEIYNEKYENEIIFEDNGEYAVASWMPLEVALKIIGDCLKKFWKEKGTDRLIEKRFGKEILNKYKKSRTANVVPGVEAGGRDAQH